MGCDLRANVLEWVQGDLRDWMGYYTDDDDNPTSCAGLGFVLRIKRPAGTIERTAEILNANLGHFRWVWEDGDWDYAGSVQAELEEIDLGTGKGLTDPTVYVVNVRPRLGGLNA